MNKRTYEPVPVYYRKMCRSILRSKVSKQFGNHDVSKNMSIAFKKIFRKVED